MDENLVFETSDRGCKVARFGNGTKNRSFNVIISH